MASERTIAGQERWWHVWTRDRDFWRDLALAALAFALPIFVTGGISAEMAAWAFGGALFVSAVLHPPLSAALNEIKQAHETLDGWPIPTPTRPPEEAGDAS